MLEATRGGNHVKLSKQHLQEGAIHLGSNSRPCHLNSELKTPALPSGDSDIITSLEDRKEESRPKRRVVVGGDGILVKDHI